MDHTHKDICKHCLRDWYDEDEHDTYNYPDESMETAFNAGLKQSKIETIEECNRYLMSTGLYHFNKATIRKVSGFLADFMKHAQGDSDESTDEEKPA